MKITRRRFVKAMAAALGGAAALRSWAGGSWEIAPAQLQDLRELAEATREQLELAIQYVLVAAISVTLEDLRQGACQALNIVEGQEGSDYDPACGDLGDGKGLLHHLDELYEFLEEIPEARDWNWAAENYLIWGEAVIEELRGAKEAASEGEEARARESLRRALGYLKAIHGCPGDPALQGGLRTLLAWLEGGWPANHSRLK